MTCGSAKWGQNHGKRIRHHGRLLVGDTVPEATGYDTVGRYYARPGNEWKTIKLPEAVALARASMNIVAIYQDRQSQLADFDLSKGRFAGTTAYNYAAGVIFQTAGSAIYFSVDYDASESEVRGNVIPFFEGVKESFDQAAGAHGPTFRIGVYGSGLVCRLLRDGGTSS
jgi:hypothetical protein